MRSNQFSLSTYVFPQYFLQNFFVIVKKTVTAGGLSDEQLVENEVARLKLLIIDPNIRAALMQQSPDLLTALDANNLDVVRKIVHENLIMKREDANRRLKMLTAGALFKNNFL